MQYWSHYSWAFLKKKKGAMPPPSFFFFSCEKIPAFQTWPIHLCTSLQVLGMKRTWWGESRMMWMSWISQTHYLSTDGKWCFHQYLIFSLFSFHNHNCIFLPHMLGRYICSVPWHTTVISIFIVLVSRGMWIVSNMWLSYQGCWANRRRFSVRLF